MAFCPPSFDLIDPVLFTIPKLGFLGPFPIRWYALAYIAGLFGGLYWVMRLVKDGSLWGTTAKTQTPPYDRNFVDDLVLWVMVGVIGGGRLGYVLFYNTSMIWEEPVRVITGIQDDTYIEVISGVVVDDDVVIGPYSAVARKLKAGDKVIRVDPDKFYEKE